MIRPRLLCKLIGEAKVWTTASSFSNRGLKLPRYHVFSRRDKFWPPAVKGSNQSRDTNRTTRKAAWGQLSLPWAEPMGLTSLDSFRYHVLGCIRLKRTLDILAARATLGVLKIADTGKALGG